MVRASLGKSGVLRLAVSQGRPGGCGVQWRAMQHTTLQRLTLCCALSALCTGGTALAQACGSLDNSYGPFDYVQQKDKLGVVEKFHFTPQVESLVTGSSSAEVGQDLDYTLRAFPNHHRALLAMARLGQRERTPMPRGARYAVECYFERALRFRPHDHTARLLYANYLFQNRRAPEAFGQMELVATEATDNAFTHYNLGLMYLEHQRYDRALQHAHQAYGLGSLQPGLRQQLERLGQWQEPSAAPPAVPTAPVAPADPGPPSLAPGQ